jgi:hypothetical protein
MVRWMAMCGALVDRSGSAFLPVHSSANTLPLCPYPAYLPAPQQQAAEAAADQGGPGLRHLRRWLRRRTRRAAGRPRPRRRQTSGRLLQASQLCGRGRGEAGARGYRRRGGSGRGGSRHRLWPCHFPRARPRCPRRSGAGQWRRRHRKCGRRSRRDWISAGCWAGGVWEGGQHTAGRGG